MKDSTKLLNFNFNRTLSFKSDRKLDIKTNRKLMFDPHRGLGFNVNRNLGFGKRGVVFRGYICPICEASVAVDAVSCDECGVEFQVEFRPERGSKIVEETRRETKITGRKSPPRKQKSQRQSRPPVKQTQKARKQQQKKRPDIFSCPICSIPLYVGTQSCPGCGTKFGPPRSTNQEVRVSVNNSQERKTGGVVTWEEYHRNKDGNEIVSWHENKVR